MELLFGPDGDAEDVVRTDDQPHHQESSASQWSIFRTNEHGDIQFHLFAIRANDRRRLRCIFTKSSLLPEQKAPRGPLGHGIGIGPARTLSGLGKYRTSRRGTALARANRFVQAVFGLGRPGDRSQRSAAVSPDTQSEKRTARNAQRQGAGTQGRVLDGLRSSG